MQAGSPAIIVAPAEDTATIEVVASRPDQAQKIDRRIYRVKDNAHAAQSDTLQLLRGLPAVVVTPDDQLLLLGSAGVTVLVDERRVQGDITQYLRTLHGSEIERIEIITNPSAQFAAQGSGGIINIVLRRTRTDGVSGSASVLASSLGRAEGSATVKTKHRRWAFELQGQANFGAFAPFTFRTLRTLDQSDGTRISNGASGRGSSHVSTGHFNGKVTYDLDAKTTLSVTAAGGANRFSSDRDAYYLGLTPGFRSFFESSRNKQWSANRYVDFAFDHKGKVDGETLKASVLLFRVGLHPLLIGQYDNGGRYVIDAQAGQQYANGQIDWTHPIGKRRILSVGGQLNYGKSSRRMHSTSVMAGPARLFDTTDAFGTSDSTFAAYTTYQLQIGRWTFLPGLRLERFNRVLTSPGRSSVSIHSTRLFPTFHLDRPLGDDVSFSLSFAKRIDRPDPTQLRPYPMFTGGLAVMQGNPRLRDQTADNFEVNLHYHHKKLDLGAILYDRETGNLFDNAYSFDAAGDSVSTPINAGHKTDRGAEIDLLTPLLRRLKGTASVNLFNSAVPLDLLTGSSRLYQFRYTANATLDWQGMDKAKRPGDVGQLQLVYESATRAFQYRHGATASANLSYTHNFSRKLAMTGALNGLGARHTNHQVWSPAVQEYYDKWTRQPEFKIKLVMKLGADHTASR